MTVRCQVAGSVLPATQTLARTVVGLASDGLRAQVQLGARGVGQPGHGFKKFAGIDVFDIEIAADTIERVVETVAALEPTFGGINLEDIKGPECFEIEAQLKERMKIPVFHDDQHGSGHHRGRCDHQRAIAERQETRRHQDRLLRRRRGRDRLPEYLLVLLGAQRKNIWVCDIDGVVHEGRNTSDGPLEGGLCAEDQRARAGGRDRRRRYFLRVIRAQRADAWTWSSRWGTSRW